MTLIQRTPSRLAVALSLALAVLFSVPAQGGAAGMAIAGAGSRSSLGADAPLHRMSNGKIAFVDSSSPTSSSLAVINPDGSGLRRLARCPTRRCDVIHPVWSPDGRRLAFLRGRLQLYGAVSLYVMNANGSGERRVASCGQSYMTCWGKALAWSPDGTRLAIARGGSLDVLALKTGGVRRLTARLPADLDPAWSPDGSSIAFGRASGCGSVCPIQPYIVHADGRGLRRLSTFWGDLCCGGPLWSPDGRTIAFNVGLDARWVQKLLCRGRCPSAGIYAVNPDGSHRRLLVPAPQRGKSNQVQTLASWAPDGRHILYYRVSWSGSGSGGPQATALWVMNANGTGQRCLYRAGYGSITDATWSPDGQLIAFSVVNASRSGLFVMEADGRHLHRLVAGGWELAWQPIP